jgi:hypothetical protein
MKNITYLFLILFFVGCTDLDLAPEDAFTEFEIFKSPEAYRSYLAKLYGAFSLTGQDGPDGDRDISIVNDEGFTSYNRVYWKAQQLTTDETVIAWADAGIQDLHLHNWTSENQFVRVLYYRIALIVSIANDFIKQSSPGKLGDNGIAAADQEIIKRYRAEARYLRALAYWHALDLFGEIPLVTEITSTLPAKSTRQEIFDFIESELNEIEPLMAGPRANEYGRADQAALWMLRAKLYINAEVYTGQDRYTDCLTACSQIINAGYQLDAQYQTLFMTENHLSQEIIFALNSDGKNTQNWGSTTFLVHGAVGGAMVDTDYGISGGWAGMRTTSTMVGKFPDLTGDRDSRAIFFTEGQTLDIEDIIEFTHGYAVPKFVNISPSGVPGSDVTHVDTDYPMFRLADAYLMYAECVLRGGAGGDQGTAVGYINELRRRAYGDGSGDIQMIDLTLPFILDERCRELYWEATRRVDLIRFNQYTENGVWPWKGNVKEGRTTESFRNVFPIPASELLANPNIDQADGY